MIEILPLASLDIDSLYATFNKAYADYARSWSRWEFEHMLKRRGYNSELSFGAFENGELVSFILNGVGTWQGRKAVYDTGTGTIKEARGKRLTSRIFKECELALKQAGYELYVLEVLQNNQKAFSIYRNDGFKISREFNYFIQDFTFSHALKNSPGVDIREIQIPDKRLTSVFFDFEPSWQNSFDAIQRSGRTLKCFGAYKNEKLVGMGVIEPATGDIAQLAVQRDCRRQRIGSGVLAALSRLNTTKQIRIINTEISCESITGFLNFHGVKVSGTQYEMIKDL